MSSRWPRRSKPRSSCRSTSTPKANSSRCSNVSRRNGANSTGLLVTRAASGIPEFDELMDKAQSQAPTRSLVSIDDVGRATAFLALDGAKLITGGITYIDGGYHIID